MARLKRGGVTLEEHRARLAEAAAAKEQICSKCGETKPATLEHFSPDTRKASGLQRWCRPCTRKFLRTPELQALGRESAKGRKEARARDMRAWRERNPERVRIYGAVKAAKKSGELAVQPCRKCGAPNAQAHHHNGYDPKKPLDVEWLCAACHVLEHHPRED